MYILQKSISWKTHLFLVTLYLTILGSHLFDDKIYLFVIASIFLIDWKNIFSKESLLVAIFILSIYIIWFFLDHDVLFKRDVAIKVISQLLLIFSAYLLGRSIKLDIENSSPLAIKYSFYLLFSFFIAYSFMILYSYFTIKQDSPLTWQGLFVNFPNEYKRLHVNGGRLISTIIAYYLTISSFIVAYLVIFFDKFKTARVFSLVEFLLLIFISLFSLYIASLMGRRTTIVLFIAIFALLLLIRFIFLSTHKEKILIVLLLLATTLLIYYFFGDILKEKFSYIYHRLTHQGLRAKRFTFWIPALKIMLEHPFGGGHSYFVSPGMKLAHNAWLDIGKDFGVIPFVLFILIAVLHLYYFAKIAIISSINNHIKFQILIILCGLITMLMIEPIFTSDKTFIAYLFFLFGFITQLYKRDFRPKKSHDNSNFLNH